MVWWTPVENRMMDVSVLAHMRTRDVIIYRTSNTSSVQLAVKLHVATVFDAQILGLFEHPSNTCCHQLR